VTYIKQAPHDETERAKWRVQADRSAAHMKAVKDWGQQETFTPMFVFDDGMVELPITVALITRLSEKALADWIFDTVLEVQGKPITRADGESADGAGATPPPGMELGHAAPQGPETASRPDAPPAGAAVSERCRVTDEGVQCNDQAAGGVRLNLYATPTVQKRYGRRVMLSLILDIPVCRGCLPKLLPAHVINGEQWKAFSKVAQQRNAGVLPDPEQSELVLCEWAEPDYVALRKQIAKHRAAANDAQPASAAKEG
jgi:hypothetical protein